MERLAYLVMTLSACSVLVTGCGSHVESSNDSDVPAPMFEKSDSDAFDQALQPGILKATDNCIWIIDKENEIHMTLAFEEGSVAYDDGAIQYRGHTFHSGERVAVTGGFAPNKSEFDIPTGCESDNIIYRVSPVEDIDPRD